MKKFIIILLISLSSVFASCSLLDSDLYEQTDYFVEQLSTTYESYGLFGITKYARYTEDGKYRVAPIGRLINVRIESYSATSDDYEALKKKLERHYKNNKDVNDVYICGGGTVMIDCRN